MSAHSGSAESASVAAPIEALIGVVGAQHVCRAGPADAVDFIQPEWVVEPGTENEVARVLRIAHDAGLAVTLRGAGTKIGWGNPPQQAQLVVSLSRLNSVLEHAWADLTVTAEAGCSIANLQHALGQHGQQLAIDPLWPERATIGGVLATNDTGALRLRFGGLRDLVIGVTLALPDGTLAKSGGKVVKNVAGYDLPKLVTGSYGSLAAITQATFRLHPLPKSMHSLTLETTAPEANRILLAILDSSLTPTSLQVRAGRDEPLALDIHLGGVPAALDAQISRLLRPIASGWRDSGPEVWRAREKLFEHPEQALVAKISLLPAQIAPLCERLDALAVVHSLGWRFVVQATGIGFLRFEANSFEALARATSTLRQQLESERGSLVVLACPPALKPALDIWGSVGDALPLMQRIKREFDPRGILNPGRFYGGI